MKQLSFNAQLSPEADIHLADHDVIVLNTSAGKDSQAMLHYVHERARAAGVSDRLSAVHCDLGRIEWPGTVELAREQAQLLNIPFVIVRKSGGDLLDAIERRGMWPSINQRYCTSDFKRGPVRTLMTKLADKFHGGPHNGPGKAHAGRPCKILNCMGHRAEESSARAKALPFTLDHENGRRVVHTWLPIHDWWVEEVWARIHASGLPYHPAYGLGMSRLSCLFCIFGSRRELLIAGKHNPELLADYVAAEQRMGHKFRVDQTLFEIQAALGLPASKAA